MCSLILVPLDMARILWEHPMCFPPWSTNIGKQCWTNWPLPCWTFFPEAPFSPLTVVNFSISVGSWWFQDEGSPKFCELGQQLVMEHILKSHPFKTGWFTPIASLRVLLIWGIWLCFHWGLLLFYGGPYVACNVQYIIMDVCRSEVPCLQHMKCPAISSLQTFC